jgi:hypothetical protein
VSESISRDEIYQNTDIWRQDGNPLRRALCLSTKSEIYQLQKAAEAAAARAKQVMPLVTK